METFDIDAEIGNLQQAVVVKRTIAEDAIAEMHRIEGRLALLQAIKSNGMIISMSAVPEPIKMPIGENTNGRHEDKRSH